MNSNHNQFEELCLLASNESWCWKIFCTTCGHLHFKYSYILIGKGVEIDSPEWIITERKTSYSVELGHPPKRYEPEIRERFLNECLNSSIGRISKVCKFPDWLRYLGLVVHHFNRSQSFKDVSREWSIQLSKLVEPNSAIHQRLIELSLSDNDIISIKDLEKIEYGFRRSS